MSAALSPVTTTVVGAVVVLSVASMISDSAMKKLAMLPGNTVLGEHHLWNIATSALVETDVVRLSVQVALMVAVGYRAEQLAQPSTARVGYAVAAAVLFSGACVSFGSLMAYLSTTDESYLYKPLWGTGPSAVALAVAAHQVLGDTPVLPAHAPFLTYSLMPLLCVAVSLASQYALRTAKDAAATALALLSAWVYLRWLHAYAPGCVGDTRDEFEFLAMLPNPFRIALRPLVKLIGAALLRLPPFAGATGDGMKSLPPPLGAAPGSVLYFGGGGEGRGGGGVGAAASDPVAERRRERALKALDKKLAELRSSIRSPAPAAASPALAPPPAGGSGGPGSPIAVGGAAASASARAGGTAAGSELSPDLGVGAVGALAAPVAVV